ncbi:MAG TPA: hypothetical protein VGM37_10410 [Armatimonadota bacterium]|jgi:hypothetical protein
MATETPLLIPECRTCPVHERNQALAARVAELEALLAEVAGIAAGEEGTAIETAAKPLRRRGGIE